MMGGLEFGMFGIGALIMLAFWALVIGGVVWLVVTLARGSQAASSTPTASQTPLDILKTRYAKGEITKEQFDQLRRDLGA
jgi:putative membrane protein